MLIQIQTLIITQLYPENPKIYIYEPNQQEPEKSNVIYSFCFDSTDGQEKIFYTCFGYKFYELYKNNNNTNILKSIETNTDNIKLNLDKISPNTELNNYRCITELNQENNNNNKKMNTINVNNINKNNEKIKLQNGGTDIISTIYDDNTKLVTIKDCREKGTERHNYSIDFDDSEEPTQQKINESYRPKMTIQGFLQTDTNNIKMNARLIKEKNIYYMKEMKKLNN